MYRNTCGPISVWIPRNSKGCTTIQNPRGCNAPQLSTAGLLPAPEIRFYSPRCVCIPPLPRNTCGISFCFWKSLPDSQAFPLLRSCLTPPPELCAQLRGRSFFIFYCYAAYAPHAGVAVPCSRGLTPLCTSGDWPETEYFENSELR